MGAPNRAQWLVRAGGRSVSGQRLRTLAIPAQALSRRPVPPVARSQAKVARADAGQAGSCRSVAVMTDLISVIVATYNRPDALDAVLRSLSRQTDQNFEVLVADDGSKPDTGAVVAKWQGRFQRRLVHVWHPDNGFRLAEIRNRAIL